MALPQRQRGAALGAGLGSFIPGLGTAVGAGIGAGVGFLGGGLFGLLSNDPVQQTIEAYKRKQLGRKPLMNPMLLNRATMLASGGGGVNPAYQDIAMKLASGEGGVNYNVNQALQMLAGGLPGHQANAINRQIGERFDQLRRNQGASAARRGLADSTITQRQQGDIYNAERDAIADAYLRSEMARQQLGLGILGRADQSLLARQGLGASHLGRISEIDRLYQAMGFQVLSDADRQQMGQDQFNVNLDLAAQGANQARTDAMLSNAGQLAGTLYSENRAGKDRAAQLAMLDTHNSEMMELLKGLTPAVVPGETPIPKPSLIHEKARNLAGGLGTDSGRGSPFLKPGANLNSAFKRKSVLSSRQGGGTPMARSANPATTGSRGNLL